MRNDMGRVIIERPRRNSSAPSAKARWYGRIVSDADGFDYDGLTRLPSSSKQNSYFPKLGDKSFTDVLGPFERFLASSAGRPWNEVYSDIARILGSAGWGVRHILTAHLDVAVYTYRDPDGRIWHCDNRGPEIVDGSYWTRFYVEPESGILRKHPDAYKRAWRPTDSRTTADLGMVPLDDGRWAVQIQGLWFFGVYGAAPAAERSRYSRYGREYIQYESAEWPDRPGRNDAEILRFRKLKSCSKKEIRDLLRIRDERLARKERRSLTKLSRRSE
jgi:hypothetical protein